MLIRLKNCGKWCSFVPLSWTVFRDEWPFVFLPSGMLPKRFTFWGSPSSISAVLLMQHWENDLECNNEKHIRNFVLFLRNTSANENLCPLTNISRIRVPIVVSVLKDRERSSNQAGVRSVASVVLAPDCLALLATAATRDGSRSGETEVRGRGRSPRQEQPHQSERAHLLGQTLCL